MFIDFFFLWEREKNGEKGTACEGETPIGCLLYEPSLGIKPKTQVCALAQALNL